MFLLFWPISGRNLYLHGRLIAICDIFLYSCVNVQIYDFFSTLKKEAARSSKPAIIITTFPHTQEILLSSVVKTSNLMRRKYISQVTVQNFTLLLGN